MNQLFMIMRRWLLRDKKRTVLTLASITLSVFLISFVGVYISTAINAMHAMFMYDSPAHVTLSPRTPEQVKILDSNAAWESHAARISFSEFGMGLISDELRRSGESVFPDISINGTSVFGSDSFSFVPICEMYSGDSSLFGRKNDENGDQPLISVSPGKPHEVVVSAETAEHFGLVKGGELNIRCTTSSGRLFYGDFAKNLSILRDDNGDIIYHEDADGRRLAYLYRFFFRSGETGDDGEDIGGEPDEYDHDPGLYGIKLGFIEAFFNKIYSVPRSEDIIYTGTTQKFPPMYAKRTGEPQTFFEYTATVADVVRLSSADIVFSIDDADILPMLGDISNCSIEYAARVKKEVDAESAAINAAKGIGIFSDADKGYELNISLLQLEGRQYEYVDNIAIVLILIIIVMGLFMFLARLIINNAFEISSAYRTEQYGALKTIGASDRQIFTMIMIESAVYMLITMPAGMGLAVLFGKIMLTKIRALHVFDPIYGEGVSDMFFSLKLSPAVMLFTFACAFFSVFFSAYADAMRVKRMPPIRSAGYSSSKQKIKKRSVWLSRRLFGYPFGFAVKCISRQKARFADTLFSAVISGIFIMSLGCLARSYTDGEQAKNSAVRLRYDQEICEVSRASLSSDYVSDAERLRRTMDIYDTLVRTGYYEEIIPMLHAIVPVSDTSFADGILTEGFRELRNIDDRDDELPGLYVYYLPRESYDKYIKADISYDELASSGKMLLCDTACAAYYGEQERTNGSGVVKSYIGRDGLHTDVFGTEVFSTDDIDRLSLTYDYIMRDNSERRTLTETVDIAGLYTTEQPEYMSRPDMLRAVIPADSVNTEFRQSIKKGADEKDNYTYRTIFCLNAKEDMKAQATEFVRTRINTSAYHWVNDFIADDSFEKNGIAAVRIAGYSFAGALAAVVLLNLFSTMSANMINRRRDLSMMRSCGMSMKQVTLSLVIESSFYAVITAVVSTFAGCMLMGSFVWVTTSGEAPTFRAIANTVGFPALGMLALFATVMLVMAAAYVPALLMMNRSHIADEIRTDL